MDHQCQSVHKITQELVDECALNFWERTQRNNKLDVSGNLHCDLEEYYFFSAYLQYVTLLLYYCSLGVSTIMPTIPNHIWLVYLNKVNYFWARNQTTKKYCFLIIKCYCVLLVLAFGTRY